MRSKSIVVLCFAVAVAACRGGNQENGGPATPPSAAGTVQVRSVTPAVMLRHEIYGLAVRDAIVRGDLESARRNARDLGAVQVRGTPEVVDYARPMNEASATIAGAPDLGAAARATGALVQSCADCHARMTGPTRAIAVPAPLPERGRVPRMRRHAWAMNELWDGLVGNSEDPWHGGAEVLADPSLAAAELVPKKSSTPEVDRLAASVQTLGQRAQATNDTAARAVIYGELVATCADCHARTR